MLPKLKSLLGGPLLRDHFDLQVGPFYMTITTGLLLFVDPYGADGILGTEDDDFRLLPGSPAIDSGRNETEPPLPAMDLDGYPRILNDIVDLGAYESMDRVNADNDAPGS